MSEEHVQGVIDLTFLDIQDESQLLSSLEEKNPNNSSYLGSPVKSTLMLPSSSSSSSSSPGKTRPSLSPGKRRQYEDIKAIRLSNNHIRDMSIIINPIVKIVDPILIQWLDLSFNEITGVTDLISTTLPNLSTLYLHANKITKLPDIKRLSACKSLNKLTLYGNPVEEKKHYKKYTLYHNTNLTHFDSTIITKQDRQQVEIWSQTYRKALHPEENE